MPPTHWRVEDYFDADPKAPDRTYARRGGFLAPVDFPALEFGIAPNNLEATDTTQLLGLLVAPAALDDAGYGDGGPGARRLDRDRVSVILGVTGTLELVIPLGARLGHPIWRRALKAAGVADDTAERVVRDIADSYVGWQENSFPGLLGNVAAGRIANRLDLGGTNCVIDAACASSLGALNLALLELAAGRCDMALTRRPRYVQRHLHVHVLQQDPGAVADGGRAAVRRRGDGTILGEGLGILVLKRLDDARRDGDRVYAVITRGRDVERRQGERGLRAERGGAGEGLAAGVRAGGGLAGDGRAGRGARDGDQGRRRDRAGGPERGLPRGEAGGDVVRAGVGQVADRPHQGGGGGGGADQGGAGLASQGPAADGQGHPPARRGPAGGVAVLRQHRSPALAAPPPATPDAPRSARSASAAATSIACWRRPGPRCPASTGTATSRSSPSRPTRARACCGRSTPGPNARPGRRSGSRRPGRRARFDPGEACRLLLVVDRERADPAGLRAKARALVAEGREARPRRRDPPRDRPGGGGAGDALPRAGGAARRDAPDAGLPVPDDARGAGRGRCRGSGRHPEAQRPDLSPPGVLGGRPGAAGGGAAGDRGRAAGAGGGQPGGAGHPRALRRPARRGRRAQLRRAVGPLRGGPDRCRDPRRAWRGSEGG